mmetsp:Transcript_30007/g.69859  ORF Transcript_30007/g.69859 Transcript_30007/m.69859 type:complete len:203 (+) Transcript_30007:1030-1638(+)
MRMSSAENEPPSPFCTATTWVFFTAEGSRAPGFRPPKDPPDAAVLPSLRVGFFAWSCIKLARNFSLASRFGRESHVAPLDPKAPMTSVFFTGAGASSSFAPHTVVEQDPATAKQTSLPMINATARPQPSRPGIRSFSSASSSSTAALTARRMLPSVTDFASLHCCDKRARSLEWRFFATCSAAMGLPSAMYRRQLGVGSGGS